MNVGDSDWIRRALLSSGWEQGNEEEADVFIVNTCSVREKPEQKVYSLLGRLARYVKRRPEIFVAVGGCVAQQIGEALFQRFSFVRLVFGADGVANAPSAIMRLASESGTRISLLDFTDSYPERSAAYVDDALSAQAFVNIMQGCDNYCSYCIVPFVRGRQKSRLSDDVVAECRELASRGVKEITLLGQNVNSFGLDASGDGISFAELLERVAALPGIMRLRFTTSHPKDISDDVIAAFARLPNLTPALHLPLQSGSDRVLKKMGRRYTIASYLEKVSKLREARPDIALTTDIIVGFPTETEEDFRETVDAIKRVGFVGSYSFMYSDRPGTAASRLESKVEDEVKARRLMELQAEQETLTLAYLQHAVGTRQRVLVEGASSNKDGSLAAWRGRDEYGRVVNFTSDSPNNLTGQICDVDILEAKKHSLWGKAV